MAYFDGSKSSTGGYARLEYSYSQSTTATTINLTLKVYNGTCEVNKYAKVSNGIATNSNEKTSMRVMERVSQNVIRVLLK